MSPSESEDDVKKVSHRLEPLCLFCFPEDVSSVSSQNNLRKTYVNVFPRKESDIRRIVRGSKEKESVLKKPDGVRSKEDVWLKKRTEARIRRRRMKEPIRNLRTYFLSVKHENVPQKSVLPSLFEVLETVKDAWPPPPSRTLSIRHEDQIPEETKGVTPNKDIMKGEQTGISPQLLNRRLSVPEELMRKYSVTKEGTSEESETNKTMIEITPSSTTTEETARRKSPEKTLEKEVKAEETLAETEPNKQQKGMKDAYQQTNGFDCEPEEKKQTSMPKRVTQSDYYSQGKQILKVKAFQKGLQDDGCTCRDEKPSSTTASAKEESDESVTTDSIPSSSPTQLPKRESSSDNLSSESDHVRCTCNELTSSKDTSTDIFHSGKSTLSQTVSDKSISTQDSTVSINSVSTRGSTVSDNSNSTTPEVDRTSAKETTTSPDYSPRTPRSNMNRKNRRRDRYHSHFEDHKKTCPRHHENKHSKHYANVIYRKQCPVHHNPPDEYLAERGRQQQPTETNQAKNEVEVMPTSQTQDLLQRHYKETQHLQMEILPNEPPKEERYKWAKLSQEELYMMQQLRHRKFIENQKKSSLPVETTPETQSIDTCETETGNVYKGIDYVEQPILIPRYSALPRSLSMIVNTSSGDTSVHNSDSDNQSLADSLEDQPTTHVHKLYFDTKKESKPVRGDVNVVRDSKLKHRQPRGRAFFVSIKDPYGEDEMLESIEKIPQPPEKIKNQISERHLNITTKHKHLHKTPDQTIKSQTNQKKRKTKSDKNGETGKSSRMKKSNKENSEDSKKDNQKLHKNRTTRQTTNNVEEQQKLSESEPKQKDRKSLKNPKPEEETNGTSKRKRESKEQKGRFTSKIPVPVSSRSTSSSPERDDEDKPPPSTTRPRTRLRRERESSTETSMTQKGNQKTSDVETTQILEITQTGNELSLHKPHAVIHPSQIPDLGQKHPLIMPPILPNMRQPPTSFQPNFRQTPIYNKQLLLHQLARRSPVPKFRQRFEVIPEEKSSSLSSAEEKNPKETSTKFAEASTSPLPDENVKKLGKIQFQSYNVTEVPNFIVAKISNDQLETLKVNDNQKIIMISSKEQNSNSTKGRDALIAMNREDFNRLAKGWMNFYRINENGEGSDNEENHKTETKRENSKTDNSKTGSEPSHESNKALPPISTDTSNFQSSQQPVKPEPQSVKCLSSNETKKEVKNNSAQVDLSDKPKVAPSEKENRIPEIDENIRFHSSNTILRSVKATSFDSTSGKMTKRQTSLPELRVSNQNNREVTKPKPCGDYLPKVSKHLEDDDDDTDSDSTDYMEPPSPRVPPLSLGDFPSDATLSSSDSELEEPKSKITTQSLECFQGKKRGGTNRPTQKKGNSFESLRYGKKKNSEWSVTVAGTVELSRSHPDLEMRLSFPVKGSPPVVCQSDSGFAEDSNYSKPGESLQDLDFYTFRKDLPISSENTKQKWTVTVKNPKQGESQELRKQKLLSNSNHLSPDMDTTQNRSAKKVLKATLRDLIKRKMYVIWPKVQRVIQQEFSTQSGRLLSNFEDFNQEELCLSVRGNAISLERKQKPPTMTERDVTRRYTSRTSREPVPSSDNNQNSFQIKEESSRSVV